MSPITEINLYKIDLPLQKSLTWGKGKGLQSLKHVIVELVTKRGSAFAEAVPRPSILNETQETVIEYIKSIAERVRRMDLTRANIDALSNEMFETPNNFTAKAAINCALYEVLALTQGRALLDIIGYRNRTIGACYIVTQHRNQETLATDLQRLIARGITGFKIKLTGDYDVDLELARTTANFPQCNFYLDGNELYDFAHAQTLMDIIGPMNNVLYVEEPLPKEQTKDRQALMRYIQEHDYNVKVVGDDSCKTFTEIREQITAGTLSMVNLKVPRTGISEGLRIADHCQQHDVTVMIGSHAGYVIAAYHAWVIAQHPGVQCKLNEIIYWTNVPETADLITARPQIQNGEVTFMGAPQIKRTKLPEAIRL
jgi:L-alanine-DL-glutamate epimerase-like enolase superfamily enzyme